MSQVYGFAKQSGGFAAIDSEVGRGTSVKLYLPRATAALVTEPFMPETPDAHRGNGETILVVEDDEQVRSYVVETLRELNYLVLEAGDAARAIEVFNRHSGVVDLLLTDVIMPGENGRVLSQELARRNPDLKVIFMSGYSRDAIVRGGRLDAGVFLLQKPVSQGDLARKIRDLLRRSTG